MKTSRYTRTRDAYLARGFGDRLFLSLLVKAGVAVTLFLLIWTAQANQPGAGFPCYDNFNAKCQKIGH